jgi:hypothetical protein
MKKYYFYLGYSDGSGKPHGYIVKCYTNEQYLRYTKCGLVLVLIGKQEVTE